MVCAKHIAFLSLTLAVNASSVSARYCAQPSPPYTIIYGSKPTPPTKPICYNNCSKSQIDLYNIQVDQYNNEIEKYYKKLKNYANELDEYYRNGVDYIKCMVD